MRTGLKKPVSLCMPAASLASCCALASVLAALARSLAIAFGSSCTQAVGVKEVSSAWSTAVWLASRLQAVWPRKLRCADAAAVSSKLGSHPGALLCLAACDHLCGSEWLHVYSPCTARQLLQPSAFIRSCSSSHSKCHGVCGCCSANIAGLLGSKTMRTAAVTSKQAHKGHRCQAGSTEDHLRQAGRRQPVGVLARQA